MTSLAHHALLAHLRSGKELDKSDPVIQDQLFSVKLSKKNHLEKMRKLRLDIGTTKSKAYKHANFRCVAPVNYYMIDKVVQEISEQLFDIFSWDTIRTTVQTQWKEYFHSMYELLVIDRSDHIGNLIAIKAIIEYHDVLEPPSCEPGVNDTMIHNLKRLFATLKTEQMNAARAVGDLTFQIREGVRHSIEIQTDLNNIHRELHVLNDELKLFNEIIEKSEE
jgi:hypothetical protein